MENNRIPSETLLGLKTQLQGKKTALESQLSSFAKKDPNLKDDWDTKYPRIPEGNIEEAADEVEEYSTTIQIEFGLEQQLKDVNDALARMEKGTYGLCENCGKEISLDRLKAFPEARLCAECAGK